MKVTSFSYDITSSSQRIDKILSFKGDNLKSGNCIKYDELDYDNAWKVSGITLCVCLKNSKLNLDDVHINNLIIYKCFLSEITACLRSNESCQEIDQHDNCIMAVYLSNSKDDVLEIFNLATKVQSVVSLINGKLQQSGIETLKIGVGIDLGQYIVIGNIHDSSPSQEIHWIGSPNTNAYNLGMYSNSTLYDEPIMVTSHFFQLLPETLQSAFTFNSTRSCYQCNLISPL